MTKENEDVLQEELSPFLGSLPYPREKVPVHRRLSALTYCLITLLGISVTCNVLTYYYIHTISYLDSTCVLYTQQNPTPIDIPIHYTTVNYDGTFLANRTTDYRLPASPAVDEAWEALGTKSQPLLLSPSQASRAGISHDHLKTPSGDFPVIFEFNHHLHCLNLVRKAAFFNYDYYSAPDAPERHIGANEETVVKHVTHCIDMLRQVIQCKPDLGVFGQYWVKDPQQGIDGAFVDFNTDHKCIDWEPVRKWVYDHQNLDNIIVELKEGDKILDIAP
ncbi:hypothetical protein F5884DRAFT_675126 [Xylogone sp. PMI_703]|nr:hypothetical protein F5884DRAFT_675126 [Xylogone sp. PMI_703]